MNSKYCQNCGNRIPADSEFCPMCGAKQVINNNQTRPSFYHRTNRRTTNNELPPKRSYIDSIKLFFKNWNNFKARSTRAEFWWLVLTYGIINIILGMISNLLEALFVLILLIPYLALFTRRLRDGGESRTWLLIFYNILLIVPMIDIVEIIIFGGKPSKRNSTGYYYTH